MSSTFDTQRFRTVHIDQISLDYINPRIGASQSETEALQDLIQDQREKLYYLAEDIINSGQNPTENISLIPDEKTEGNYIVVDGNRRVASMKLALNPNLILHYPSLKKKFLKLNTDNMPRTLFAYIFPDREAAEPWIRLKHTGESNGVGTVRWDSVQQARFDNNNKYKNGMQFFDYLSEHDLATSEQIKQLEPKITTFERMLSNPDFREKFGIRGTGKNLYYSAPSEDARNAFEALVEVTASKDFTVNRVKNKQDIIKFTNDLFESRGLEWINSPPTAPADRRGSNQLKKKRARQEQAKRIPTTSERKTLIPKSCNLPIQNQKVADLFDELQRLDLESYSNVAALSLRCFIEMSADLYIEKFCDDRKMHQQPLHKKLEYLKKEISESSESPADAKRVRTAFEELGKINALTEVLHGYIHSTTHQATTLTLKNIWNTMEPIFNTMYDQIKHAGQADQTPI